MNTVKGITLAFLIALGASLAAEEAKTICGIDTTSYSSAVTLIQVGCKDYNALRKVAPQVPWPEGQVTEVLVHATAGSHAYISVDGVGFRRTKLIRDSWGRLIGLLAFPGADHTKLEIRIVDEKE